MKTSLGMPLLCSLLLAGACSKTPTPPGHRGAATSDGSQTQQPIRVAIDEDLPTLDPHHHQTIIGSVVLRNIYEPLVCQDRENEFVGCLAQRWESPDFQNWSFYLRPEVLFHDGTPLSVDDVVFSLERARTDPRSEVVGFLGAVESVSGDAAAGRIDIVTTRSEPLFLEGLPYISIIPASSPKEITDPVGTGPYRFVSYERGNLLRLEGFDGYWQGASAEAAAEFAIVPDAERAVDLLDEGELDLVRNLPPRLVDRVESNPDLWVESRLSQSIIYLQLDPGIPPFNDLRVRQAVHLAVDRQELMERITLNHSRPASQMLGPDIFGHDPKMEPTQRDLTRARQLLAQARPGESVSIKIETTDAYLQFGEAVKRQLEEAGFQVEIVPRPWPELYADLEVGNVGAWLGVWSFDGSDAAVFFDVVVHSPDGKRGNANFTDQRDAELDGMIRAAGAESDLPTREALLQEISRRETARRILIPLLWPLDLYGTRRDLEWEARKDGNLHLFEIRRTR